MVIGNKDILPRGSANTIFLRKAIRLEDAVDIWEFPSSVIDKQKVDFTRGMWWSDRSHDLL